MLYLLSISVTIVGTAILVALILFSHRNGDPEWVEHYESGEWEPSPGSLPPARPHGDAIGNEPQRGSGIKDISLPLEEPSAGRDEGGFTQPKVRPDTDGGETGSHTSVSSPRSAGPAASIPILRPEAVIPGLGNFELVHFLGKAGLGTLEDQRELDEIHIEGNGPQLELKGEVAITSKHIIVFDAKTVKKIPFGVVEKYRFHDPFLIIKKKNVKTKKTLLKVFGNAEDFQYILGALIPL